MLLAHKQYVYELTVYELTVYELIILFMFKNFNNILSGKVYLFDENVV